MTLLPTVTGAVDSADLGPAYMHEHIFVLTPDVSVKQIGLGLAAAVLIDATVVRLVLVPAVMGLLGPANWWLPGWLGRRLPGRPGQGSEPAAAPAEVH